MSKKNSRTNYDAWNQFSEKEKEKKKGDRIKFEQQRTTVNVKYMVQNMLKDEAKRW